MYRTVNLPSSIFLVTLIVLIIASIAGTLTLVRSENELLYHLNWSEDLPMSIHSIAWSPNGRYLAIGYGWSDKDTGGVAVLTYDGKLVLKRDLPDGGVNVAWSYDGKYLAVGTAYDTFVSHCPYNYLYLFSVNDWKLLWSKKIYGEVRIMSWSPTDDYLAIGTRVYYDNYGNVIVFDRHGNILWHTENLSAPVLSISWSKDGRYLAVGGTFKHVVLFDGNTGDQLWSLPVEYSVWYVTWYNKNIVVGTGPCCSNTGKVYMISASGSILWKTTDIGWIRIVKPSPDGRYLAAASSNGRIYVLDPKNGNVISSSKYLGSSIILILDWSPDGKYIATGTARYNNGVYILDTRCNILLRFDEPRPTTTVSWYKYNEPQSNGYTIIFNSGYEILSYNIKPSASTTHSQELTINSSSLDIFNKATSTSYSQESSSVTQSTPLITSGTSHSQESSNPASSWSLLSLRDIFVLVLMLAAIIITVLRLKKLVS